MGNPAGVRRDFDALERRRFQGLRLLRQGLNQSEVARRLRVVRQSVARWAALDRKSGERALRQAGRAGRKPRLTELQKAKLEQRLLAPNLCTQISLTVAVSFGCHDLFLVSA